MLTRYLTTLTLLILLALIAHRLLTRTQKRTIHHIISQIAKLLLIISLTLATLTFFSRD